MYAASQKKGGAGGVPQKVAKEFVAADKPGKLLAHKDSGDDRRKKLYPKG